MSKLKLEDGCERFLQLLLPRNLLRIHSTSDVSHKAHLHLPRPHSACHSPPPRHNSTAMATARPLTVLAHSRPMLACFQNNIVIRRCPTAMLFSTTSLRAATPTGPPPKDFRIAPPTRWDNEKETTLDRAGRYFLLTEMLRGMYVVLEQFFRPPFVEPTLRF